MRPTGGLTAPRSAHLAPRCSHRRLTTMMMARSIECGTVRMAPRPKAAKSTPTLQSRGPTMSPGKIEVQPITYICSRVWSDLDNCYHEYVINATRSGVSRADLHNPPYQIVTSERV